MEINMVSSSPPAQFQGQWKNGRRAAPILHVTSITLLRRIAAAGSRSGRQSTLTANRDFPGTGHKIRPSLVLKGKSRRR
jgi:hypothetical protein